MLITSNTASTSSWNLSHIQEETGPDLTPPDKYTSEIPSFESLLSTPLPFVLTHVRNPNEAVLIYEIGTLGTKLDTLVRFLVSQLQQEEVLDRKWRSICNSRDPTSAAFVPSLAQFIQTHFHHQATLMKHFRECINALKVCHNSLRQYVEMNKSVADELMAEGCVSLANNKIAVAKAEELLLTRIEGLLTGAPFAHASISWDSIISDKSTPTTMHNPAIVKTQQPDPDFLSSIPKEKTTQSTPPHQFHRLPEPTLSPITPSTKPFESEKGTAKLDDEEEGSPYFFESDHVETTSSSSNNTGSGEGKSTSSGSVDSNSTSNNYTSNNDTSNDASNNNTTKYDQERSDNKPQTKADESMDEEEGFTSSQYDGIQWQTSQALPSSLHSKADQLSQINHNDNFT